MAFVILVFLAGWVQTYVLKLSRSGEEGEKVLLLIESGTRIHTVQVSPLSRAYWRRWLGVA
mgnify:CR=1 FL=1